MRLIDADALIEEIANMDISEQSKIFSVNMLRYAPTAYDVEKVVAELQDLRDSSENGAKMTFNRFDRTIFCKLAYENQRAIDIVRKGGVE